MSKWSITIVSLHFVSNNSRRKLTSSLKGCPWVTSKVKSQQQLWESLTFRLEQAFFSHESLCTPCEQSRAVYDLQGNWQVAFVAIKSMWDLYGHSALNRCNKLLEPAWCWRLLHDTYIFWICIMFMWICWMVMWEFMMIIWILQNGLVNNRSSPFWFVKGD
jgi:hypothetical protein